ncbi:hypothetical protein ACJROX_27490 [Pseudalkalibacillus sp. A8]|uniref:hypothetical protein n=1 Tax=Pseudalkalibacillus sp. A8 TaxID=3382641 RepID=UPI0038B6585F
MRPLRPIIIAKATERFETPPGKQAQVDWGQFTVDWNGKKKLETLIGCHLRAMQYFGGKTETCLYDNMKTVVAGQDDQGEVIWNERFTHFASHHGFNLRRCQPYRARTKGKVENGVGYVRKNF